MYLHHIYIETSKAAGGSKVLELLPKPKPARWPPRAEPVFRWTLHHVKEVFLLLLPPKFVLDGSSKVSLTCGPRGDEPQYRQVLGTTAYYQEDFDFVTYLRLSQPERDETILRLLEKSFLDIGSRHGWSQRERDVLEETVQATRECDFAQICPIRKLSKSTPCRTLKLNIRRHLNRNDGEAWDCEVLRRDGTVVHTKWLHKRPHYLVLIDLYHRSEWEGDVFRVLSRNVDRIEFQIDVSPFLREAQERKV